MLVRWLENTDMKKNTTSILKNGVTIVIFGILGVWKSAADAKPYVG